MKVNANFQKYRKAFRNLGKVRVPRKRYVIEIISQRHMTDILFC